MLAAAIDLAMIEGRVFDDTTGNGFDAGEQVAGATVTLYRDNGNGVFNPSDGDTSERTDVTDADGLYQFSRLTAGSYFVVQPAQTASGIALEQAVSPLIVIDADDVQGQIAETIDPFDTTVQSVRDETDDGIPVTSSIAAPEVIGGERDLFVNRTSPTGAIQLSVNDPLLPDLLSFDSIQLGDGERRVIWDGPDGDASVIDDAGLNGVDLTRNGSVAGLRLQAGADRAGGTAIVRVYSDDGVAGTATRFSTATILIPETGGAPSAAEFVSLGEFTATSGGGADLSNVGAIELEISGTANVNGTAELIGSLASTTFTQNFANFESADLSLSKTVDAATPTLGQNVTFTITVNNAGPDNATGVVVNDLLPSGLSFVSSQSSQGTYDAGTGIWNVGTITTASTSTLSLVATVVDAGVQINTAEIAASGAFDPDSTPGNADVEEDDFASVTVTPQVVDLSLSKAVGNASPNIGENVTFTITATNAGPSTATGVVVRDSLQAGLTLVTATPSQGTYDSATGQWSVGSLTVASSATLTLVATVSGQVPRTNTAEVIATDQADVDSTPNNDVPTEDDQASVIVTPQFIDLSLTKNVDVARPTAGQTVVFTLALDNTGPVAATGVVVADTLPAGLTFVSAVASAGTYSTATGLWTVGSLAPDATSTLQITALFDAETAVVNTAQVNAADQFDIDSVPGNSEPGEDDQASITVSPATADLSLAKTVSTPTPNVGDTVTFTLAVTNSGPDAASGVSVRDLLPAEIEFVSATASVGTYDEASGLWTVGAVPTSGAVTLEIVGRALTTVQVSNTAEITASDQADPDSTPDNNVAEEDDQATVVIEAQPVADLSVTKTASDPAPNVGETVTFTVTLANDGPNGATGVRVTDFLPDGLAFISANLSAGTYNAATGIWDVGALAASATETLELLARVDTAGAKTNVARVTSAEQADPDSTPGNNDPAEDDQAQVTITPPVVDLSLIKTASAQRPSLGESVDFTVTVSNAGPDDATGVAVTDLLPEGLSLVNSAVSSGSYDPLTGVWMIGDVAANGSATLTLTATVDSIGGKTNIAEVSAADQFDIDSTPGNDLPDEDDRAAVTVTPASADLSLMKTVSNASPNVGSQVTFTLTARNDGPDSAANVVITDALPAGLTLVSSDPSVGSYDASSGTWTLPTLDSGAAATLDLVVSVDNEGDKTNIAEITASNQFDPDSTPGNGEPDEDDQASVLLSPQLVDLALAKIIDEAAPTVGDSIEYTITLSNAGPSTATGVVVTDQLPAGVQFTSATASQGSYNALTGIWTVGSVATDATPTLRLRGVVQNTAGETNTAEVTAVDQPDRDSTPANGVVGEDDQASVTFTTQIADLSLTKIVDDATPDRDDMITFTVQLANAGPNAATGVEVLDLLPPGLAFVSAQPTVGSYSSVNGLWTIPQLDAGTSASLTIVATAQSALESTNRAEVTASDQFDPDSTPNNNDADEDDLAIATVTPNVVDIAVSATVDNDTPLEGDTITITVTTSNAGPTDASGVALSIPIPAGLTLLSINPEQGSYDPATGIWTVGSLAAGADTDLVLTARVDARGIRQIPIETIATDQFDLDSTPDNDVPEEDDQTLLVIRAPRLLSKRLFLAR